LNYPRFTDSINRWYTNLSNRNITIYFLIFFIAFFLRLIPELLIQTYPIGYETITYYAPAMIKPESTSTFPLSILDHLHFIRTQKPILDTFTAGPLFYVFMWTLSDITGAQSFLLLKITGPLLYGFLGISFFIFIRRVLKFDKKLALFTVFLLIFSIAALRESWDRYRDVLALTFLFATLTALSLKDSNKKYMLTIGLSVLTVLSRDYIGFLLIVTVLGYVLFLKKGKIKNLALFIPALISFAITFNEVYLHWNYLSQSSVFFLKDYWFAVKDAFSIFFVCYILLLPLILIGFRKNSFLNSLIIWLLLGSFSFIIFPWFAIPGYQRWLILLIFPFVIYCGWGLTKISSGKKRKIASVLMLVWVTFGIVFVSRIRSGGSDARCSLRADCIESG